MAQFKCLAPTRCDSQGVSQLCAFLAAFRAENEQLFRVAVWKFDSIKTFICTTRVCGTSLLYSSKQRVLLLEWAVFKLFQSLPFCPIQLIILCESRRVNSALHSDNSSTWTPTLTSPTTSPCGQMLIISVSLSLSLSLSQRAVPICRCRYSKTRCDDCGQNQFES
jgi:hypothetical protein